MAAFHEIKAELESWSVASILHRSRNFSQSRLPASDYRVFGLGVLFCYDTLTCTCFFNPYAAPVISMETL